MSDSLRPHELVGNSPAGSSVHEIFQARILEWVAISFSRGSSQPRNQTRVSCVAGRFFTIWVTRRLCLTIWTPLISFLRKHMLWAVNKLWADQLGRRKCDEQIWKFSKSKSPRLKVRYPMILEKSFYLYWLQFPPLLNKGFSGGASAKESACQYRRRKRCGFDPSVGKILWSRKWQPTPVFLPGKFHGQKSLAGYSPWGHKESDTPEHTYLRGVYLLNKGKWPLHLPQSCLEEVTTYEDKVKDFLKALFCQKLKLGSHYGGLDVPCINSSVECAVCF